MYGKYPLFYESPKNWGYYVHAQTVCTRPLLRGEGPGDEAIVYPASAVSGACSGENKSWNTKRLNAIAR